MKWIFEKDFLPGDHTLMAACTEQGHTVELVDKYGVPSITKEPIVFRGGIGFYMSLDYKNAFPGFYCTLPNYSCSMYYPRFHRFLLNNEYLLMPYGSLWYNFDWITNKFGPFFIKPNSGSKIFTGKVARTHPDIGSLRFYDELKPESLVLLAPAKPISREWRFVVCNRKIVTGSLYKPHEEDDSETTNAGQFAELIVNSVDWQPDPVWTIDICRSDGKMYLLEINSFSCAGLYACDPHKVVKAVSEQAEADYKEYNEC